MSRRSRVVDGSRKDTRSYDKPRRVKKSKVVDASKTVAESLEIARACEERAREAAQRAVQLAEIVREVSEWLMTEQY